MRNLAAALITIAFIVLPLSVSAQMTMVPASGDQPSVITLPDPLTPEAIRELVSTLSDEEVRSLLLERLDAVAEQNARPDESAGLAVFIERAITGAGLSIYTAVERVPTLWTSQRQSFVNFHERLGWTGIGKLVGILLFAIAIGLIVEQIVNRITRRWHSQALSQNHPDTLRDTLRFLFVRLLNDVYGLIAFFIVTRSIGLWLMPEGLETFAQVIMVNLVVIPRIGAAFVRFLLAPNQPEFRLVHTDDASARFLYRHQIGVFLLMGFSIAIVTFNDMNGVSMGQSRLGFWLNLSVHLYLIFITWKVWDGLVLMMRGADPDVTPLEAKVARAFPIYAICVSVFTWILVNILVGFEQFALLQSAPHYEMMFLLMLVPAMDTLVRGLVRHLTPPMTGEGVVAERAYKSTKHSYIRVGRVLVFAIVVLLVADIWGLDPTTMAAAGVGAQFAGRLIENLMILAIGYLAWELVSLLINRKLAAEQTAAGFDLHADEPGGGEGGGQGGSRLSTVLPMVRLVLQVAIITMTVLIALGNIGVDITPLLAGAGIVGLAIGFGAQTLVRDVVSGLFFLVDDAFRVGEYVVIGDTVGTVEKISVRSLQLRHHQGPIHTVPYGEIPKITNNSRDWVIMKLKFTVPFDTDVNKIKKIFKKIGADILEAEYADDIIQTFKSQGVYDVDDVGIVVRGKFMTKPGGQWVIRKDIYTRVTKEFEENGIEFARKEVRVNIPGIDAADGNGGNLDATQKSAIGAAAADAAEKLLEEEGAKK